MSVLRVFCLFFFALPLLFGMNSLAMAERGGATLQVKEVLNRAMEIQTDPELAGEENRQERARLIRQLIADNFDAQTMAENSLENHWGALPASQRNEFRDLFIVLFQDSYTRMVLNFLVEEDVRYGEEEIPADEGRKVQTTIMRVSEHIPVDYTLHREAGRWLITDVEIDGVSIVNNYRNSFNRVIRASSFSDLLERLRAQKEVIMAHET